VNQSTNNSKNKNKNKTSTEKHSSRNRDGDDVLATIRSLLDRCRKPHKRRATTDGANTTATTATIGETDWGELVGELGQRHAELQNVIRNPFQRGAMLVKRGLKADFAFCSEHHRHFERRKRASFVVAVDEKSKRLDAFSRSQKVKREAW
jgi:hypothetical protein